MASKLGKALKQAKKTPPVPALIVAGSGETLIREGPKGLKSDAGILAGIEVARKAFTGPTARRLGTQLVRKGVAPLAVAGAAWDVGETVYEGAKAVQAHRAAQKEKKASEEKYGTVAAATRTRKRRERASRIARGLQEKTSQQRDNLIRQGLLEEGAIADLTNKQIEDEINRGMDPTDTSWMRKTKKNAGS